MNEPVSGRTKLALGVTLPLAVFVLLSVLLLGSVGGQGESLGFAGTALFLRLFIIVPLVFFANALLMRRDWKSTSAVLLAGFVPPTAAAVYEYSMSAATFTHSNQHHTQCRPFRAAFNARHSLTPREIMKHWGCSAAAGCCPRAQGARAMPGPPAAPRSGRIISKIEADAPAHGGRRNQGSFRRE